MYRLLSLFLFLNCKSLLFFTLHVDTPLFSYVPSMRCASNASPTLEVYLQLVNEIATLSLTLSIKPRRHGKFRPMLMKLVTSNDASTVTRVVGDALQTYRDTSDSSAAVDILTKLKGIGPATASLLLSVHDPERVLFFSDEAFYWLCCGGKRDAIKYNKKEYAALGEEAQKLIERLGVRAVDLEKVAYVVMNQTAGGFDTKDDKKDSPEDQVTRRDLSKNSSTARSQSEKRKRDPGEKKVVAAPLRRSKRTRHSVEEQG